MQYKLINKKNKKETICIKIELDGFDYYVSEDEIKNGDYFLSKDSISLLYVDGEITFPEMLDLPQWKKVIATNNSNINIPKVIDEVYNISIQLGQEVYIGGNYDFENGVRKGYNKAKETYQYTEKDMVEFAEWIANSKLHGHCKQLYEAMIVNRVKTVKELLEIWNNQNIKTIYYE